MDILEKIDKQVDEGSGTELVDKIYRALTKVQEFKKLSMDRQGEISIEVNKMMKKG